MTDTTAPGEPPGPPLGYIDLWHGQDRPAGDRLLVRGWALDDPAPRAILIALDEQIVAVAELGMARPDVAAVHPERPDADRCGWSAILDLRGRAVDSTVLAVDVVRASGATERLAEAPLAGALWPAPLPPGLLGFVDLRPAEAEAVAGSVQVQGWVVDGSDTPPAVLVALGDAPAILARTGVERPDVAAAYPNLAGAGTSGWVAELGRSALADRNATVTVRVVRGSGDVVVLGQASLARAAWPGQAPAGLLGHFDVYGDSGPLPAGRLRLQGWVVDACGPPLAVAVSIGGRESALARLGRPRPDVVAAHPTLAGAGTSGWELSVDNHDGRYDRDPVTVDLLRASGEFVRFAEAPFREVARPWGYQEAALDHVPAGVFGGIDAPSGNGLVVRGAVEVIGWTVDTAAEPVAVVVTVGGKGAALARLGYPRPDEARAYPDLPGVERSGWTARIDLSAAPLGTVEVAAWLGRANGDFVKLGHVPVRILGGLPEGAAHPTALAAPTAPQHEPRPARQPWIGTDERWAPPGPWRGTDGAGPVPRHPDGRPITCEIHIPISPTPGFFTRVHYLAASIRRFGGIFTHAKIVVTVGDDDSSRDLYALNPWSRHYPLEWRWLDSASWQSYHYFATAVQRFCYDFESDVVLLLDADTLMVGPLDDLFEEVVRQPAFYGVVTYISPARSIASVPPDRYWSELYKSAGLEPVRLSCEYPGWGVLDFPLSRDPGSRFTPPFFNLGFLCSTREIMREVGDYIYEGMSASDRFHQTVFRCQVGLCLALERHNIPWRTLAPRFNFGNVPALAAGYPADFEDVRLIHYYAGDDFVRDADLGSPEGVGRLVARRNLQPINARLRDGLAAVHGDVLRERSEGNGNG